MIVAVELNDRIGDAADANEQDNRQDDKDLRGKIPRKFVKQITTLIRPSCAVPDFVSMSSRLGLILVNVPHHRYCCGQNAGAIAAFFRLLRTALSQPWFGRMVGVR